MPETEAQLQQAIIELARALGWLVYHTFDSRHSAEGFPDLVLVRQGELIFAELKSAVGKVKPEQQLWLDVLDTVSGRADPQVKVYIWRPADWPEIERALAR
jgi:hypothetical protein